MSDTIEVNGEEYELSNNPSLRTVREVQSMQMDVLLEYIEEDDLRDMDSLEDEGEIVQKIIENEGYGAFQDVMWENSMLLPVQTISLACDEQFSAATFEKMGSQDFKEAREKATEMLGGDANDFFNDLGIGMSLTSEEMKQKAAEARSET